MISPPDLYPGFLARIDDVLRVLEADPPPAIVVRYPVRPGEERPTAAGMAATLRRERESLAADLAAEVKRMAGVLLDGERLDGRAVSDWPLPLWIPEIRPGSRSVAYLDAASAFAPEVAEWAHARGLDRVAPGLTADLFASVGEPGTSGPAEAWINGERWPAAGVHVLYRIALDYSPRWAACGAFRGVLGWLEPIRDPAVHSIPSEEVIRAMIAPVGDDDGATVPLERVRAYRARWEREHADFLQRFPGSAWVAGFDPFKPAPVFAVAVRLAAGDDCPDSEVDGFAADLFEVARKVVKPIVKDAPATDLEARATVEIGGLRVLAVDERFAVALEGLGSSGHEAAAEVRRRSAERVAAADGPALFEVGAAPMFSLWTLVHNGAPVWLVWLARVLWDSEEWAEHRAFAARNPHPALPWGVVRRLGAIREGSTKDGRRRVLNTRDLLTDEGPTGIDVIGKSGEIVARFGGTAVMTPAALDRLRQGIGELGKEGTLAESTYRRLHIDTMAEYRRYTFRARWVPELAYEGRPGLSGGSEAFCRRARINDRDRAALPAVLEALASRDVFFDSKGRREDTPSILSAFEFRRCEDKRYTGLYVIPGTLLRPDNANLLKSRQILDGSDLHLLPVLEAPDVSFAPVHAAGLFRFQWNLLAALRIKWEEYLAGGPFVSARMIADLADRSGLPAKWGPIAYDWSFRGEFPTLLDAGRGRVILADPNAHELYLTGARISANRSAGARSLVDTRINGKGPTKPRGKR